MDRTCVQILLIWASEDPDGRDSRIAFGRITKSLVERTGQPVLVCEEKRFAIHAWGNSGRRDHRGARVEEKKHRCGADPPWRERFRQTGSGKGHGALPA